MAEYLRVVRDRTELPALPAGSVIVDAFAAVCVKIDDGVLGWRRCTPAVDRGEHRHPPYLPGELVWIGPEER